MLDRKKWQAYTVVNLILKKISKIGATRCQILSLKCTKIDFGLRIPRCRHFMSVIFSAPRREREGKGGEGENDLTHPLSQIPGYATDYVSVDITKSLTATA